MKTTYALVLLAATLGLGCSTEGSQDAQDYDQLVTEYTESLDSMEAQTEAHRIAVVDAEDTDTIHDEEANHHAEMLEYMQQMTSTTNMMEGCEGMSSMSHDEMMNQMQTEMDEHYSEMSDATSVDQMHQLEEEHQAEMGSMLETMSGMENEMMGQMGMGMQCSGGGSMFGNEGMSGGGM